MKKMYDEATRKRWQEATCKAIKDGEDHARLLHNIIKRCRERYGSLLKKFLSVNEELRTTKRTLCKMRIAFAKSKKQYINCDWYDEFEKDLVFWTHVEEYWTKKLEEFK